MRALRGKRIAAAGAAAAGVGLLAGGWLLAGAFESPEQREARVAPPSPGPITARVERGDLSETVAFRGTVERDQTSTVKLPAPPDDDAVVTKATVKPGANLVAGSVVSEVNGRPVLALPGAFRFYRALTLGDTGPDVRQLQAGLAEAGYRVSADGIFGKSTDGAIRALYARAGYTAPTAAPNTPGETNTPDEMNTPEQTVAPPPSKPPLIPPGTPQPDPALILPKNEVVAVGTLPAFVSATPGLGADATADTTITLQRGTPRVVASVPRLIAEKLKTGTTGTFRPGTSQTTVEVAVESVRSTGPDATDSTVTLAGRAEKTGPAPTPLDDTLLTQEGTAQLDVKLVARDSLIVPTVAVSPGGKRRAHIMVRRPDGDFRRIAVTEIAQLDGRSAIEPADADALHPGDVVRVG